MSVTRLELSVAAVEGGDLAAVAHGDAVALELAHEVVRHRLAQVGAAVEQGHERAAAGEPDGGLAGGVPSADDADALGAAQLGLGRPGGVEDADSLVLVEVIDREPSVLRAGREQDRARGDLVIVFEADDVASVARLREPALGRGSRAARRTCAPG